MTDIATKKIVSGYLEESELIARLLATLEPSENRQRLIADHHTTRDAYVSARSRLQDIPGELSSIAFDLGRTTGKDRTELTHQRLELTLERETLKASMDIIATEFADAITALGQCLWIDAKTAYEAADASMAGLREERSKLHNDLDAIDRDNQSGRREAARSAMPEFAKRWNPFVEARSVAKDAMSTVDIGLGRYFPNARQGKPAHQDREAFLREVRRWAQK